jgi:hypothetical protein
VSRNLFQTVDARRRRLRGGFVVQLVVLCQASAGGRVDLGLDGYRMGGDSRVRFAFASVYLIVWIRDGSVHVIYEIERNALLLHFIF